MSDLRDYQRNALEAVRQTVRGGVRRLVLQAPTGSGKTRVAADLADGALRKGNRLAFVVPMIGLIDQAVEMFYAEGIRDIGVIQANHQMTDWSKPIQVCSIQTIHSRGAYPNVAAVVFDECHVLHKAHIKWMGRLDHNRDTGKTSVVGAAPGWENVPFVGLSATPWTHGLGRYFESLLVMSTTTELIAQGYLSPFRVFAADRPDLSRVKVVAGDYQENQLSAVMQDSQLVANIIETWRSKWNRDKTLLFAVDCNHAKMLQARFLDGGISCAYQDASTPIAERAAIKRAFQAGDVKVICNVGTLTTGADYDVRCLILARPTKSEILYVQIIGRALRIADGKENALILDHSDTTARLGLVTDIHHEHLHDGKFDETKQRKPASPPLPKPCPQCAFLIPPRVLKCPECGFERKIESRIFEREGELVEFTGSYRKKKQRDRQRFPYSDFEKMRFFLQLRGYALQQKYKRGWAAHKFLEKFGHWPLREWEREQPIAPGPEVMAYVKFSLIRWAKSKSAPQTKSV